MWDRLSQTWIPAPWELAISPTSQSFHPTFTRRCPTFSSLSSRGALHRTGWKAASSGIRPVFSTLTNTDYNLSNLLFLYLSQGKVEYSVTQSTTLITISSFLNHQVRMWQREARGAEQSEAWDPMNLERQMPRCFDRLWITCHFDVPRFPSFGGDLNRKQRKTGDTPFF